HVLDVRGLRPGDGRRPGRGGGTTRRRRLVDGRGRAARLAAIGGSLAHGAGDGRDTLSVGVLSRTARGLRRALPATRFLVADRRLRAGGSQRGVGRSWITTT